MPTYEYECQSCKKVMEKFQKKHRSRRYMYNLRRRMQEDQWEWHFYDTVRGSDFLGDQDAQEILVKEAPLVIYDNEHLGVPFSRTPEGKIAQRPFAGHFGKFGKAPMRRS